MSDLHPVHMIQLPWLRDNIVVTTGVCALI